MHIIESHNTGLNVTSYRKRVFLTLEDNRAPIATKRPKREIQQTLDNRAKMQAREISGKRVLVTVAIEVASTDRKRRGNYRLKQRTVTLSIGTATEAELAIDAVLAFAMSLDGKHLIAEEIPDSQVISSQSASE